MAGYGSLARFGGLPKLWCRRYSSTPVIPLNKGQSFMTMNEFYHERFKLQCSCLWIVSAGVVVDLFLTSPSMNNRSPKIDLMSTEMNTMSIKMDIMSSKMNTLSTKMDRMSTETDTKLVVMTTQMKGLEADLRNVNAEVKKSRA